MNLNISSSRVLNWFFYGHIQIALAAAGLSWLSLRLAFGEAPFVNEWPVLAMIFFATLGVYTLHRYLSFQRAGIRPTTERYNIVSRHPKTSLTIGISSIVTAGLLGIPHVEPLWQNLLWAVPITIFYLSPPIKGWKRLRDIPFIKVIWVGIAWQIMTNEVPVWAVHELIDKNPEHTLGLHHLSWRLPNNSYAYEALIRFLFTCSIAILFDFRDTVLDRSQKVKTIANTFPVSARILVSLLMLVNIYFLIFTDYGEGVFKALGSIAYLMVIITSWATHEERSEAWYAVMVNGLLWGPVVAGLLFVAFD